MTWKYGQRSTGKLLTSNPELQQTFDLYRQRQFFEITIIWGFRTDEQQMDAFLAGNSKKKKGSKHQVVDVNGNPFSDAIDFAPWIPGVGIPWKDTHAFAIIGGLLIACADQLGYTTVYGGDWDMDGQTTDQTLMDWGHIQRG